MHRAIGHACGNEPRADGRHRIPATPQTPICLFSASKAITALLVHKLSEEGSLSLDERVGPYIPEYGQRGKDRTTVRPLLAHRAGIPTVPMAQGDYRVIYEWDAVIGTLCAAKPFEATGERQAYHAITGGFILGALVRRVAGIDLNDALRQWIAEPLGCRHLTYGLPPEHLIGPPWMLDRIARRISRAVFWAPVSAMSCGSPTKRPSSPGRFPLATSSPRPTRRAARPGCCSTAAHGRGVGCSGGRRSPNSCARQGSDNSTACR